MRNLAKRFIDVIISLIVTAILLPVFAVLGIVVSLRSKGAAMLRQEGADKDCRCLRHHAIFEIV